MTLDLKVSNLYQRVDDLSNQVKNPHNLSQSDLDQSSRLSKKSKRKKGVLDQSDQDVSRDVSQLSKSVKREDSLPDENKSNRSKVHNQPKAIDHPSKVVQEKSDSLELDEIVDEPIVPSQKATPKFEQEYKYRVVPVPTSEMVLEQQKQLEKEQYAQKVKVDEIQKFEMSDSSDPKPAEKKEEKNFMDDLDSSFGDSKQSEGR